MLYLILYTVLGFLAFSFQELNFVNFFSQAVIPTLGAWTGYKWLESFK